jgi:nitroreductase
MAATMPAALELLLSRQSVGIKHLVEPGPGDAELQTMCQAALRAPDHGALVPFRLAVVRGAGREALARLFEAAGRAQGKGDADVRLDAERALRAPVTVAVLARIDLGHPAVPAHEQWVCIGGALTNLLNAAHALGFGGKMLSGAKVRDADVQRAFCGPRETLIGWIALGTPAASPARAPVKPAVSDVMREWTGSVACGNTPG